MIYNATTDDIRAQLLRLLHRAARIFAKGYCLALKDIGYDKPEQQVATMVMTHIDIVMQSLTDQFGVEWSLAEHEGILLTIRQVCIKEFMPF